jgi:peptide-methionine (S)-S-oxide reductase
VDTAVGYCGGRTTGPTYRQVCAGGTGHAEAVLIEFDPKQIGYEQLLDMFWEMHNPSAGMGMRSEGESQYRSVIFTTTEEQARIARESKKRLEESGRYARGISTQIVPAPTFYRAEEYHQRYYEKKGVVACRLG